MIMLPIPNREIGTMMQDWTFSLQSCDFLIAAAKADGSIIDTCVDGTCPPGYHTVRAYNTP